MQRTPEVRRHRILEIFGDHVFDRPDLNDAGVVDQDVDGPPPVENGVDGGPDVGAAADVAA